MDCLQAERHSCRSPRARLLHQQQGKVHNQQRQVLHRLPEPEVKSWKSLKREATHGILFYHRQVYLSHLVGYRGCLTGDRIREWRSVDHHHGQWIRQGRHCCQGRSSSTGSWIGFDPVVKTIQISPITYRLIAIKWCNLKVAILTVSYTIKQKPSNCIHNF